MIFVHVIWIVAALVSYTITSSCGFSSSPARAFSRTHGSKRLSTSLPLYASASQPAKKSTAKKTVSAKKTTTSKSKQTAPEDSTPDAKLETVRKGDLVAFVSEQTGLSKKVSEDVLGAVLQGIQVAVNEGKKVSLPSFGVFTPKLRSARKGRNPKTGEEIQIAASISPGFTAAKAWKESLNEK